MPTHSITKSVAPTGSRTLTTSKGRSCETTLTNQEALQILTDATDRSDFEDSLVSHKTLSHDQFVWVHICAIRRKAPKPAGESVGDFTRIVAMFASAKSALKWPKLHLRDTEGHAIVVSLAGAESTNAGNIYVKNEDTGVYLGKVTPLGEFFATERCPSTIAPYLRKFSANPEEEAAKYGLITGHCCFCNRSLSDERSTEVGYGPVCAARWNLSWGK